VLLAVVALVLSYAGRAVLRSGPFADRASAALRDPAVQADVADHLTSAVIGVNSDLAPVRPLIRAAARGVIATGGFAAVFHRGVLAAHAAVVNGHRPRVLVDVSDAAVLLQGLLERLAPSAARTIGAERVVDLLSVKPPSAVTDIARTARAIYSTAWIFAVAALLLALAALWLAGDVAGTARSIGIGVAAAGLLLVAFYLLGLGIVGQSAPAGRGAAARAIWSAFAAGLRTQALWLAAAGALIAGIASASRSPHGMTGSISRQVVAARRGVLGALVALALGIALVLEPGAMLSLVAIAIGLGIIAVAVADLLTRALAGASAAARGGQRALRAALPFAVGAAVIALAAVIIASGGGAGTPAAGAVSCNGEASLCSRSLNDVALAATHNSYASVTLPNFLFGQQDGTIADQLKFGIRGFLIDTYYGLPDAKGRVRTDTASLPKRSAAVAELGESAVKAAESLRSRLGSRPTGQRNIYLCHGFCELGAVRLSSALGDLRAYMVQNPGAVVMIVNQDEGVTAQDITKAFEQAGLGDLIYRGPLGPFPTLRQMIDSDQRLIVMAENEAGGASWYRLAYAAALQETPYRFGSAASLTDSRSLAKTCRPNRGPSTAPLFLLNNWIDTTPVPRPSNAAKVNGYAALLRRAQTCQRIRHRLPNLIAVDFYRRGDVLSVVRKLNESAG
jgi:hypothetical protein